MQLSMDHPSPPSKFGTLIAFAGWYVCFLILIGTIFVLVA